MLKTASRTDIGRIRTVNEDRMLVVPDLNGFCLAIVADGMGGHQAGDTASQLAVDIIGDELKPVREGITLEECERLIKEAIGAANRRIYEFASLNEALRGMGTTVVLVLANRYVMLVAHIGDSRAYLCRGTELIQLTEDHSLVNELVRSGQISQEEALSHPRRNVLTRALGTDPEADVEVRHFSWGSGDMVLLCSDGLSGLVDRDRLCTIMNSEGDLEAKVDLLVHTALVSGGDDNITAVLLSNEPARSEARGDES